MSKVDISTSIAGVRMRSPLGVGSKGLCINPWFPETPIEHVRDKLYQKWLDNGVGFIKTGTLVTERNEDFERIRYSPWARVAPGVEGFFNATSYHMMGRQQDTLRVFDLLREMTRGYEDVPLIASIAAPSIDIEPWAKTAKVAEDRGADLIEINSASPCTGAQLQAVLPPEYAKWGTMIGCEPILLRPIVEAVVKAVKIPVGVKLSPEAGYPGILRAIHASHEGGARFVDMFHTTVAIAPPDIDNEGKGPYLMTDGWNPIGMMLGEWNSYQCFKGAALTSLHFPQLEIFSGGGITKSSQIIQAIMFGAGAVEVMSGIMFHGNSFIRKSLAFLQEYMKKHGYKTLKDFRGIGVQYVKPAEEVFEKTQHLHLKMKAETDLTKCDGCGICSDNICPASYMEGRVSKVDPDKCNGCGVCVLICPKEARKLVFQD
jgi:dihydropyrimidine dehydrogenase (NAD+) subunit PreA